MRSLSTSRVVEDLPVFLILLTALMVSFIPTGFLDNIIRTCFWSISSSSALPNAALKFLTVLKISLVSMPIS